MRELSSFEEFHLCEKLGVTHFQGPFVTSREPWESHQLGPSTARLADLLARLKREADTRELAAVLRDELQRMSPGDYLPGEVQLAARFAVNRHTLRRAVDELVLEGRLLRQ